MSSSTHISQAASASPMPEGVTDPNYKPLPGRLGNLTVVQLHTLEKFKKELQDEGHFVPERMHDAMLLRFLRARRFDIVKAKVMLLSAEEWRKRENVDEIAIGFDFSEKELADKYYPQFYHKSDKDGRPVYIEQPGTSEQLAKLYESRDKEVLNDHLIKRLIFEYEKFINERLPACSEAAGHPVETSCTILDLRNLYITSYSTVYGYLTRATDIGQNRYPECMGKFYIINAPRFFSTVWSGIKLFLDEVTVSKIAILGSDYQAKLLEQIPAENLPREFGGTCECKGDGGCKLSDAGPWNPVVLGNGRADAEGSA